MLSVLLSWSDSNQDWLPVATKVPSSRTWAISLMDQWRSKFWKAHTNTPQTLIPQHDSYLRKPLRRMLPCLLLRLPPMSPQKTSSNFGSTHTKAQDLSIVVSISATTLPPPFARTSLFCLQLNFQYALGMGSPLPTGDKALLSSWKRFLVMCSCTSYVQSTFWKQISFGGINLSLPTE